MGSVGFGFKPSQALTGGTATAFSTDPSPHPLLCFWKLLPWESLLALGLSSAQDGGGGGCGRVHNHLSLGSTALADFIIDEYL